MAPERLARLQEWGIYDPTTPNADDRLALLDWLDEIGVSDEELLAAHAEDRVFGVSGDRILRTGLRRWTVEEAATKLDLDVEFCQRAWRACGLSPISGPMLSDGDLELIGGIRDLVRVFGESQALGIVRVAGAGLARLAEAESAMLFGLRSEINLDDSGSELVTAKAYAAIAGLVPMIGRQLDLMHRHHIEGSRRHFESVDFSAETGSVSLCVGFADLSGFTELSATSTLASLSKLLSGFEERATETVHTDGGRVVKFLGDAVMFVSATPAIAATIACDLVEDEMAAQIGIKVRAGISSGAMVVQDGDYFGPPVNLAARLVAIAEPEVVLADPAMHAALELAGFALTGQEPRPLRGLAEPVAALAVTR